MQFTTELWGDMLVVFSASRLNNDDEPQLLGKSSVDKRFLSDGHYFIEAKIEIRPYCEPDELGAVQKMLLAHMIKELNK